MHIETFVEFIHPGTLFSETSTRRVEARTDPGDIPRNAFGYRFFDIRVVSAKREDGRVIEDREPRTNESPWTLFGTELTVADVAARKAADPKRWDILHSNMVNNRYERVCETRFGQCVPVGPEDRVEPPR